MASRQQAEKIKDLLMDIMVLYRSTGPVTYNRVAVALSEYMFDYKVLAWVSGNECELPKEIDGVKIEYEWNGGEKLVKEKHDLPNTVSS